MGRVDNIRSGCDASELILPGESAEDLKERCQRWEKDLGAVTAPERYEVFNAVHATWRHDRMRRAEAIALQAVGGGTVVLAVLEREDGTIHWSVDITGSAEEYEVWVSTRGKVLRIITQPL